VSVIDPTIFRSYDIRGVVDVDLTEAAVERIGLAYATLARARGLRTLTVGRDCREHSPRLFAALARGLTAGGADVIDVGVVATPMQYFSIPHLGADGGVQITGSHNPPEYNGLKLTLGGDSLHGEDIQALRRLATGEEPLLPAGAPGQVRAIDIVQAYEDALVAQARMGTRKLKVVIDAGNGTAARRAPPCRCRRSSGAWAARSWSCTATWIRGSPTTTPIPPSRPTSSICSAPWCARAPIWASRSTATAIAWAPSTRRAASCGAISSWCCTRVRSWPRCRVR